MARVLYSAKEHGVSAVESELRTKDSFVLNSDSKGLRSGTSELVDSLFLAFRAPRLNRRTG